MTPQEAKAAPPRNALTIEQLADVLRDGSLVTRADARTLAERVHATLAAAPLPEQAEDAARLLWVAQQWGYQQRPDFAMYIVEHEGTGDLADLRTFIDATRKDQP